MAVGRSVPRATEGERASDGLGCEQGISVPLCLRVRRARTAHRAQCRSTDQSAMTSTSRRATRMTTTSTGQDFKVADLSLAAFGRKEISLAEHEMPGLM